MPGFTSMMLIPFLLAAAAPTAAPTAPQKSAPAPLALPLKLESIATNLSGVGRVGTQRLEIVIERWSTDEERAGLLAALKQGGSDALLDAVQNVEPRAGYIRTTTSLGWDLQYARLLYDPKGGRRIVFGTDRPMSFYELQAKTRSADYEFLFGEIRLDAEGRGEGKLVPAARVEYDDNAGALEIEDYGREPVRLGDVKIQK